MPKSLTSQPWRKKAQTIVYRHLGHRFFLFFFFFFTLINFFNIQFRFYISTSSPPWQTTTMTTKRRTTTHRTTHHHHDIPWTWTVTTTAKQRMANTIEQQRVQWRWGERGAQDATHLEPKVCFFFLFLILLMVIYSYVTCTTTPTAKLPSAHFEVPPGHKGKWPKWRLPLFGL